MVATLIRLKWRLTLNTLNRSTWAVLGTIFGGLYGLGVVAFVVLQQIMTGADADAETSFLVSVLWGTLASLIWLIAPLFLAGDALMDPKQFITYAVPRSRLIQGLVLAGMVSIGAGLTLIWLIGQTMLWRFDLAALLVAVLSVPVLLVTYCLISQAVATTAAAWFSGRRARDLVAVLGIGVAVMAYPIMMGLLQVFDSIWDALPVIAEWVAYTPLAAGVALPYDAATGSWGPFALRLAVLLATAVVAALVIRAGLVKITERPSVPAGRTRENKAGKLGFFGRFPATPWGAVAARAMTYWLRDPRYGGSLIVVPAMIFVAVFLHWQGGAVWPLYAIGPFIAWMLGYAISADISYDYTAFALHVTTGVTGFQDRLGRAAALLSFALPFTVLASAVPMIWAENAWHLVIVTSLAVGMLLAMVGLSSVISARLVYPTPRPGDSPFKQPQGAGGRMMVIQLGSMMATVALMLPELVLLIIYAVSGAAWAGVVLVTVTLLKGLLLTWAGIVWGGRIYDRSQPELFQYVQAY
ncbi:transporter [Nesterenkonia flava]|uniref:Transporter n=1 Tax=Nesterenkonia flava TaxID=469799 RepID=A0ABU1FS22_9MICC|nr:transporter [Nesterenkonia flava]MDR5711459.1 transporter [Nesterenkonia flava]